MRSQGAVVGALALLTTGACGGGGANVDLPLAGSERAMCVTGKVVDKMLDDAVDVAIDHGLDETPVRSKLAAQIARLTDAAAQVEALKDSEFRKAARREIDNAAKIRDGFFPEPALSVFSTALSDTDVRCAVRDPVAFPRAVFTAVACPSGPVTVVVDGYGASAGYGAGQDDLIHRHELAVGDVTGDGRTELIGSFECGPTEASVIRSVVAVKRNAALDRVGTPVAGRSGKAKDGMLQVSVPRKGAQDTVLLYRLDGRRWERVEG